MNWPTRASLIAVILTTSACAALAQTGDKPKLIADRPQFVLVQLPSESNRIMMLTRARRFHDAKVVKTDAEKTRKATIRDFAENFDFCPVYFYVDTNVQRVKDRNFEGTLINAAGNVVTKSLLNANSKDYIIAYFGLPESEHHGIIAPADQTSNFGKPAGKALVIFNYRYQQLNYFSKRDVSSILRSVNQTRVSSGYSSRKFEIEYFPLADKLNNKIPRIYEIQ